MAGNSTLPFAVTAFVLTPEAEIAERVGWIMGAAEWPASFRQ